MDRDAMLAAHAALPTGAVFARPADILTLVQRRRLRPDARILDVGCGQGQVAHALAVAFPQAEVIGIDLSPQQIDRARAACTAPNLQFFVTDWVDFALPATGVDTLICTQVLQFIHDEHTFAEYIARSLAPNGLVVLRTPLLPEEEPGRTFAEHVLRRTLPSAERFYSERDVTELLREVGLWRFAVDKEEWWLDALAPAQAAVVDALLADQRLAIDDAQPWFWSGTITAQRRPDPAQ